MFVVYSNAQNPWKGIASKPDNMKIMGIDSSTNSYAYAIIEDGRLIDYDEIKFVGDTIAERLESARAASIVIGKHKPDFAIIEQTIYLNNKSIVIKLAYFAGILMSGLIDNGVVFGEVVPINWQKHIGNSYLTKEEKAKIKKDNKGKSAVWLKNEQRNIRKQRTMDIIEDKFGVTVDSDNISDAIGVAMYGWDVKNGS